MDPGPLRDALTVVAGVGTGALSALFGGSAPAPPYLEMQAGGTHEKKPERGREALDHYNRAMEN